VEALERPCPPFAPRSKTSSGGGWATPQGLGDAAVADRSSTGVEALRGSSGAQDAFKAGRGRANCRTMLGSVDTHQGSWR